MQADKMEAQPLMGVPVASMPSAEKSTREWRHKWWQLAGTWEPEDAAACCLAWHAPFVAWGWNSSRAMGLSWWREALKFFVLTAGVFLVFRGLIWVTMFAACGPPPMDGPMAGAVPMVDMQVASGPMTVTATASDAMPAGDMPRHGDHGHWGHGHHSDWHDDDASMMMVDPEHMHACMARAAPVFFALSILAAAATAVFIIIAARRRTALRERFGIAGTARGDCLAWTFCGVCALAQETRTLWHNRVEQGLWQGPRPQLSAPGTVVM